MILVVGGFNMETDRLGSTEFLVLNSSEFWVQMAPLPFPWDSGTHGIVGVTIDNVVMLLGGASGTYVDRVVQYAAQDHMWVGLEHNINMTRRRYVHAVSVVTLQQVSEACSEVTSRP